MYNDVKSLHIELTDKCNARCPQCIRNDEQTCKPHNWLINVELSIEDIKSILPENDLKNIQRINFCGNYGDPLVTKDFLDIIKYVYSVNESIEIEVSTNGSLRTEEWWWELSTIVHQKPFHIVFGIDGTNQYEHSLYRVNTSFEKVIENAKFFIENGGTAIWQYLIFAHNELSIPTARKMAKELGFKDFVPITTDRFWQGGSLTYNYKGNEYILERSTQKPNKKQLAGFTDETSKTINCFAQQRQEAYIDCLGYVTPCCYLGLYLYSFITNKKVRPEQFFKKEDLNNLHAVNKGIGNVVKNKWFTNLVELHKQLLPKRCYNVCGKETIKENIL